MSGLGVPPLGFGRSWQYEPAPDAAAAAPVAERFELLLDGQPAAPQAGRYAATLDPATGQPLAEVAQADAADVAAAVRAARAALPRWHDLGGSGRARCLFRAGLLLERGAGELAGLESRNRGTPIARSRGDTVPAAARAFCHNAGWADKLELLLPGAAPHGVVGIVAGGGLLPAATLLAAALAAGNTVVLKPGATSPLPALQLGAILQQAGLPPGVLGIVPGDAATGACLVQQPGLDALAFAGSAAVGRQLQAQRAGSGVPVLLQLQRPRLLLLCEDAAFDQCIETLARGLGSGGGAVLLVAESVAAVFAERLGLRLERLRAGPPLDRNTELGPVSSAARLQRLRAWLARARADGIDVREPRLELPPHGFWSAPALLCDQPLDAALAAAALDGPLLLLSTFRTPAEAIELASGAGELGAAAVAADKGARFLWLATRLRATRIGNDPFAADAAADRHAIARFLRAPGDLVPG